MFKKIFHRIPYFEAFRAFLEQWGVWQILAFGFSILSALLMSAWVKMTEALPNWAVILIGLVTLSLLLAITNYSYGIYFKHQQAKKLERIFHIDSTALAEELEDLSKKVAGLVGEFRGAMQEAWWKDAKAGDMELMSSFYTRVEGQLIEKYSYRYGADVWRLIRRTSKVIPIDRMDIWRVEHGVRGENDLTQIYMLLAKLADDVRAPKDPIPFINRDIQAR